MGGKKGRSGRPLRNENSRLSLKERGFVQDYLFSDKRGNVKEAVRRNYDATTPGCVDSLASQIMRRPPIKAEIERLLKKHGLGEDVIFQKIEEGLNATVPSSYRGRVSETRVPDFNARHKYLRETIKIGGYYAPALKESRNLNVDLQVEKMPREEMRALLSTLMKKINVKSKQN